MTVHEGRPLLFLDVDGTLLPYAGARLPSTLGEWADWQGTANPQLTKVDRAHGPRLLALDCALVWATAWMHDANAVIAPLLGLPELPVADLPEAPEQDEAGVLHWKTRTLVSTAAGRPFVWVDDEITDLDRDWVSAHHRERALLHRVDAEVGLTAGEFTVLERWLRGSNTEFAQADSSSGRSSRASGVGKPRASSTASAWSATSSTNQPPRVSSPAWTGPSDTAADPSAALRTVTGPWCSVSRASPPTSLPAAATSPIQVSYAFR